MREDEDPIRINLPQMNIPSERSLLAETDHSLPHL